MLSAQRFRLSRAGWMLILDDQGAATLLGVGFSRWLAGRADAGVAAVADRAQAQ